MSNMVYTTYNSITKGTKLRFKSPTAERRHVTYLNFAAITRCSIPVEQPPVFFSDLLPNLLCVSKWKHSIRIRRHCVLGHQHVVHCVVGHIVAFETSSPSMQRKPRNTRKVYISPRQVIDLLHQNVNARMIQSRPSV